LSLHVEILPDGGWAEAVAARLGSWTARNQRARLCLATGNTVAPVYRRTVIEGGPAVFLLDEFGGLPANDPARCASMLRRDLPDLTFDVPDVDSVDPQSAAEEYGMRVADGGLDLAIVGLGRNGHVGMNEPGSRPDDPTRVVSLALETAQGAARYGASSPPTWGITVGIRELMTAGELWLLVTGAHKVDILSRMLTGPVGPDLPASFLNHHPNARVLADSSSAVGFSG